jgi:outer membrane protein assembly factor BamB
LRASKYRLVLVSVVLIAFPDLLGLAAGGRKQSRQAHMLWKADSSPCTLTKPTINGDLLFIGSCQDKFYAVQKSTGKLLWSYDARMEGSSGGFQAAPLLYKDLILAGTDGRCGAIGGGYVYAFDQRTGKVRWKVHASAASSVFADINGPADPNGSIVFGTREGEWLSVEVKSGKVNWRFQTASSNSHCDARASVATDGVNVCFLALDGTIHCLDAKSRRELWKQTPPSKVTTGVFMYKDVLYFGTASDEIRGVDPENGKTLIQTKLANTPVGDFAWSYRDRKANDEILHIYAGGENKGPNAVLTLSDNFGKVVWSRGSDKQWTPLEPEVWKGVVIVGNCQGEVVTYGASTGVPKWKERVDGCISSFSHDDSTLYIAVREGAIWAYQPTLEASSK